MVLLFPAGILLPAVCRKTIRWWKGLIAGVFISAVIETSQLVFCRGLFEWDNMIHNGIGCMTGCIIGNWFVRKKENEIDRKITIHWSSLFPSNPQNKNN